MLGLGMTELGELFCPECLQAVQFGPEDQLLGTHGGGHGDPGRVVSEASEQPLAKIHVTSVQCPASKEGV